MDCLKRKSTGNHGENPIKYWIKKRGFQWYNHQHQCFNRVPLQATYSRSFLQDDSPGLWFLWHIRQTLFLRYTKVAQAAFCFSRLDWPMFPPFWKVVLWSSSMRTSELAKLRWEDRDAIASATNGTPFHRALPLAPGSEWSSEFQRFFRLHGRQLRTPLQSRSAVLCVFTQSRLVFLEVKSTGKEQLYQVCTKFVPSLSTVYPIILYNIYGNIHIYPYIYIVYPLFIQFSCAEVVTIVFPSTKNFTLPRSLPEPQGSDFFVSQV